MRGASASGAPPANLKADHREAFTRLAKRPSISRRPRIIKFLAGSPLFSG